MTKFSCTSFVQDTHIILADCAHSGQDDIRAEAKDPKTQLRYAKGPQGGPQARTRTQQITPNLHKKILNNGRDLTVSSEHLLLIPDLAADGGLSRSALVKAHDLVNGKLSTGWQAVILCISKSYSIRII